MTHSEAEIVELSKEFDEKMKIDDESQDEPVQDFKPVFKKPAKSFSTKF